MPNGANSVHKQLRTELEDYTTATTLQKAGRRSLPSRPARIAGINFLHRSLPHSALEVISLSST